MPLSMLTFVRFFFHVLGNQRGNVDLSTPFIFDPNLPPVDPNAAPPANDDPNDRFKKDFFKLKDEKKQLEDQLANMKLNGHKEKEDWKSIAEHHEQEAKTYKTKYEGLSTSLVESKKFEALKTEALKNGINPASLPDLEMLDFDEVQVETTSNGKILVSGADRAIASLKLRRPHWFTGSVPSVNSSSPNTLPTPHTGTVTIQMVMEAEKKWQTTRTDSDAKAYQDLLYKFKSQPRG